MGTIYVLGAGFSKTCGIATDIGMLDSLNRLLKRTVEKDGEAPRTTIEHLREQNFLNQQEVSFELFMSTLSSLKFAAEYMGPGRNVFREEEREIRSALRKYLKTCVSHINWNIEGKTILDFMRRVDWKHDFILTFNYDLLLEAAAERLDLVVGERVVHLHGAIGERTLAWPTYTKFAYRTTKLPLTPRWKRAFSILRNQAQIDRLAFIGYSMPPSDLEAKSLFNYVDWHNKDSLRMSAFYDGKRVPQEKCYSYEIVVVNPSETIASNYGFFRKPPLFLTLTLEGWLKQSH